MPKEIIMGIQIESKTISREKRYTGFNIVKYNDGTNRATITVSTGYYDNFEGANNIWISERDEIISLDTDQLLFLMSLEPKKLGLNTTGLKLFQFLDTAIYALIGGQLRLTYSLKIKVVDKANGQELTDFNYTISKGNSLSFSGYAYTGKIADVTGDLIINPTISINKLGYKSTQVTLPALINDVTQTIELEAEPVVVPLVESNVGDTSENTDPTTVTEPTPTTNP